MLIGGDWVESIRGRTYQTVNPATEEPLGTAAQAEPADMQRAIDSARAAFDEGPWPAMSGAERYRIIRQIAEGMERHEKVLSALVVAETGTTGPLVSQAGSVLMMHDFADLAMTFPFDEMVAPHDLTGRFLSSQVLRQPVGVCGLLPTWNLPIMIAVRKLGPALASGCTMVMKAPPQTPLALLKLAEIIADTDLPPGVFNLVTGEGIDAAGELVRSGKVDMVSFTGGVTSGRTIMANAADTLKRVTLELGGKSANIILDDVDVEQIAPAAALQGCLNAGQTCSMLSRVLVPRQLEGALVEGMAETLRRQKVGDPRDPTVTVGPLIREERRKAVESYVEAGLRQGATLMAGGSRPADLGRGFYYQPTLFTDVSNDMTIARDEIFGPVLTVIPYDTVDQAIRIANDNPFGLQANVACSRVADGVAIAKRIRSGAVSINGAMDSIRAPRGGFKQSGLGRECGKWALDDYLEYQAVTWAID
jgi:acyl-CoA reductase-like NAD-dependent aldehyde dehydrogenase